MIRGQIFEGIWHGMVIRPSDTWRSIHKIDLSDLTLPHGGFLAFLEEQSMIAELFLLKVHLNGGTWRNPLQLVFKR